MTTNTGGPGTAEGRAMTLPELPALRPFATRGYSPSMKHAGKPTAYTAKSVHARESILVAEIDRLRAERKGGES